MSGSSRLHHCCLTKSPEESQAHGYVTEKALLSSLWLVHSPHTFLPGQAYEGRDPSLSVRVWN